MKHSFTAMPVKAFTRSGNDIQTEVASLLAEAGRREARVMYPSSAVGNGGAPSGSSQNGEVMIRRPHLVAWSAGSEWRNRRQHCTTITSSRRDKP